MARTYVTVRCPRCNSVVERSSHGGTGRGPTSYGCPISTCPSCRGLFYDDRIVEPATKPMRWFIKHEPSKRIVTFLIRGSLLCVISGLALYGYLSAAQLVNDLLYIAAGLFGVGMLLYLLLCLYSATHTNVVVDEAFEREYAESQSRLRDPEYVAYLRKMGAKLPK